MASTLTAPRWPYALLAYASAALALAGIILPGLPTVPFLLIAAWAAARGSARLHRRLHRHPHLGPLLRHWQAERAVPRHAKWSAVLLLAFSWGVLTWHSADVLLPTVAAALFLGIGTYVVTRPTPSAETMAASTRRASTDEETAVRHSDP